MITVSAGQQVTTLTVPTPHSAGTDDGKRSLTALRDTLVPATVGTVSGAEYAVGGDIAQNTDYTANLADRMPLVIGFVSLLTFLIMAATFRSLVVALTALVLNSLSAAAAFGTLALVFQHTWAEGILDFTSNGALVAWIPLFLFVVLFGLSMNEMKQMGVGLAVAVFIDAMIIRVLVLPSIMTLLGKANWWPGRIKRDAPPPISPIDDHPTEQLPAVVMPRR